jgi:hypothetical protein
MPADDPVPIVVNILTEVTDGSIGCLSDAVTGDLDEVAVEPLPLFDDARLDSSDDFRIREDGYLNPAGSDPVGTFEHRPLSLGIGQEGIVDLEREWARLRGCKRLPRVLRPH